VAALPETPYAHNSVLWRGELYSSNDGKVQKFDWKENVWHTNALPVSGNYQLYNLNGRLYVADLNSIQQITEDGRGTRLLGSIQRRPAITSLDSHGGLLNLVLFTDAHSNLCAAVHNKVYRWDGADWRELGGVLTSYQPSVFADGVLFMTDNWNIRPARISCFDTRSDSIETCLLPSAPPTRTYPLRAANSEEPPGPLWKIPAELRLPNLSAAYWESDLFLMTDHSEKQEIVAEERGIRKDGSLEVSHVIAGEKFLPQDGCNSALYCFSRGRTPAGKVLLKFDNPDGCPPMAGSGSDSRPLITGVGLTKGWMLFTPKFLFCGREALGDGPGNSEPAGFKPGVWVVPMDSIMPEIALLKQRQSSQDVSK
jgi:hypothetical protein